MRLLIGLVLFWISTFGYSISLKKKSKLPNEFLLPIVFTVIGIVMFLAGILNMMKEFTLLICLGGIILFIYNLIKKEIKLKKVLNPNFIILLCVFIYITIVCSQMQLLHYDNFTHWGLIIKNMFLDNNLPNFENTVMVFLNYQPGSACFIYYFSLLVGKSEASMIIAQNYLIASYFFSLLVFTKTDSKIKDKKKLVLKVLLLSIYLFMLCANIMFNDLLVDTLIALMLICSFAILYYFKNDLKRAFIYNLPIIIYLFLVKNIGIILVGFSCLGLLYIGYRNKQLKKGFIYALLSGIISVAFFYIWTKHVSYVYGDISMYAKHSLSTQNILSELHSKGFDRIFEFCGIYFNHFIDILNNIPNKYMLAINVVLVLLIILYKNNRKEFGCCLAIVNIIYLLYYLILGVMYLFSMPWSEAVYLAGFDRYMLTIVFVVIGIVFIFLANVIIKENKTTKKTLALLCLLSVLFIFTTFNYYISDYKVLLGDLNYENSRAHMFDEILGTDNFDAKDDEFYFIYAPITSKNDSGYLYYLSRYKLNTNNTLVVNDIYKLDDNVNDELNNNIIVFDEDDEILQYINDNNYIKNGNLYTKAAE